MKNHFKKLLLKTLGIFSLSGILFTPAVISAAETTVYTSSLGSNSDTFDVTDFGADGNDRLDDFDAIDKALQNGKNSTTPITVKIPAGTYYISRPLRIYSNTSLIADKNATIISTNSEPDGAMVAARHLTDSGDICLGNKSCTHGGHSQIQNITIQGGTWDRNDAAGNGYNCIFRLYHGKNITIKDMTLKNCSYHYINMSGVDGALIQNVTFKEQSCYKGSDKAFWQSFAPGDKERYNSMEVLHLDFTSDSGYPLDKTPCDNVTVKGCTFENIYSGLGTHHDTDGEKSKNLIVTDNTFKNLTATCINSYSFTDVVVKNNKADTCRDFIYAQSSSGEISNNEILNTSRFGININKCSGYTISGNKIKNGSKLIRADQSTVTITGNTLSNSSDNGIYLLGTTADVIQNTIDTTKQDGIRASDKSVLRAKKNTVKNAGKFGIGLSNLGGGNVLSGNVLTSGKMDGIYIAGVKKCKISGNKVLKNKGHCIFAKGLKNLKTTVIVEKNTLKTASGEKRDLYLGEYCVNCIVKNNVWSERGFTHDPSVKAKESGNKTVK